jgi:hypothetical protein
MSVDVSTLPLFPTWSFTLFPTGLRESSLFRPLRVASTTSATDARTVGNSNPRSLLRCSEL